jgi:hypothetical protein
LRHALRSSCKRARHREDEVVLDLADILFVGDYEYDWLLFWFEATNQNSIYILKISKTDFQERKLIQ